MSAKAGWYPDPGGGPGRYRYWDGKVWSAATSANPSAAPPSPGLGNPTPAAPSVPVIGQGAGAPYGSLGGSPYGGGAEQLNPDPYAAYRATAKKRSPVGWWIAGAALLLVIVVIGVFAVRAVTGGALGNTPTGQGSENACPEQSEASPTLPPPSTDGRVHGGPVSYPLLSLPPWSAVSSEDRVPFGNDVRTQTVLVQAAYDGIENHDWVASVLVGELHAGDGFFSPQQGAAIVVKCIIGKFYGDNPVNRNDKVNQKDTIDGHEAWLVESHLTFNIPGLATKGELLIVAIVSAGQTSGLYYASIPDTVPQLVQPAREALAQLQVEG